jgi:hypothetical protein
VLYVSLREEEMGMETAENGYSNGKGIDGHTTRNTTDTCCSSGRRDGDMLPLDDCGYPRYSTYCTSVLESNTVPYSLLYLTVERSGSDLVTL